MTSTGPKRSARKREIARQESPAATLLALRDLLREAVLEVLWRQWAAIGGSVSTSHRAASLVDPEALVLMSLAMMTDELRVADVLGDWVVRNSDLLGVQRLRNLAKDYPASVQGRLGWVARISVVEAKDHRWKAMVQEGSAAPFDLARRTNKPRAVRVPVGEPAALMLRLRLAFGVGIKADVLTLLLTADPDQWASISMMARATGYTVAAVRKAIGDLAESQLIDSMPGTRSEYRAVRPRWQGLLGMKTLPAWRDWNERFRFAASFLEWVAEVEGRPLTPYVIESQGRDLIEGHPAAFRWATDDDWAPRVARADEGALVSAIHRFASWVEENA